MSRNGWWNLPYRECLPRAGSTSFHSEPACDHIANWAKSSRAEEFALQPFDAVEEMAGMAYGRKTTSSLDGIGGTAGSVISSRGGNQWTNTIFNQSGERDHLKDYELRSVHVSRVGLTFPDFAATSCTTLIARSRKPPSQ